MTCALTARSSTRTARVGVEPDRPDGRPTPRTALRRRPECELPARTLFPFTRREARPRRSTAGRSAARSTSPSASRRCSARAPGDRPRSRPRPRAGREHRAPTRAPRAGTRGDARPRRAARPGPAGDGRLGAPASRGRAGGERRRDRRLDGAHRGPAPRQRSGRRRPRGAEHAARVSAAEAGAPVSLDEPLCRSLGSSLPRLPPAERRSPETEGRVERALALVERIERFVRSGRPALALTLRGSVPGHLEVQRVAPGTMLTPALLGPPSVGERAGRAPSGTRGPRTLGPEPRGTATHAGAGQSAVSALTASAEDACSPCP